MAQRATSLGPKPSLFYYLFCFFVSLSLLLLEKNLFSPQERAFFVYFFCVSLCFSLAFFELPPFSLSLSLSLLLFFLLPSFLFFIFVSGSCFLFLLFASLLQDVLLFLFVFFFCFLSCFVLNHHVGFMFALHLVFWLLLSLFFLLCYFVVFFWILGNLSKTSLKQMEIPKIAKMKNAQKKTDILTRGISTVVLTNSVVFFFFCVSLNFACLLKTL